MSVSAATLTSVCVVRLSGRELQYLHDPVLNLRPLCDTCAHKSTSSEHSWRLAFHDDRAAFQ
jgi:hypothetical protein